MFAKLFALIVQVMTWGREHGKQNFFPGKKFLEIFIIYTFRIFYQIYYFDCVFYSVFSMY